MKHRTPFHRITRALPAVALVLAASACGAGNNSAARSAPASGSAVSSAGGTAKSSQKPANPSGSSSPSEIALADSTDPQAASAPAKPVAPAVTKVETAPGQADDDYVGAASDVTTDSCALTDGAWTAHGTVKNDSGADAKYRIYVAFNRAGTTDTRALIETGIDVADGASEKWSAKADVSDADLICILRVERTKA